MLLGRPLVGTALGSTEAGRAVPFFRRLGGDLASGAPLRARTVPGSLL